ncbi:MAG: response regulator [Planctomycetes bacterium]|jgi:two-component system chemotaxis response regulator CheY|nr:response regulator [Planctomycetota bacterium]MCC7066730.1 response regulator [Planctomycetota bacterium]
MGKRVLVVDDSQSIRQHVGATLVAAGFEVVEAVDGVDALERLTAGLDVALVLCDVNMPRLNGLELLDKLQAQGLLARVPVVMLTTEGQPTMMQRAKQAGAKGWIVKPFKPPLLVAAVQKLTSQ